MQQTDTVRLVVGGAVFDVPRAAGIDLFERNRRLAQAGASEPASIRLPTDPPTVLHLLLGSHSLALIDAADERAQHQAVGAAGSAAVAASDVSVDFDAYL